MFIYGTRAVHLDTKLVSGRTCPNCEAQNTLSLSVYRKHAHVFWIPMFPLWKAGKGYCLNCKEEFKIKDLPENIKMDYDNLKANAKGPLWQFTGLGVLVLLISWFSYATGENKIKKKEYVKNPLAGDIYDYKLEAGRYTTLKIDRVTADSIFVFDNMYDINRITKIYKIDKPENYTKESYGIARESLEDMLNRGDIISIDRE